MKIVFFGAGTFGKTLLGALLKNRFDVRAVFTIPENFSIRKGEGVRNYTYDDLTPLAAEYGVPVHVVDGDEQKITAYEPLIREIEPDIILVLGWYYMIPKAIRGIPKWGACGIHASLLPDYAGWAPLVWAMIHGEKEAGVTFFQMDESVDGGDIIAQQSFPILEEDTIREVYAKAMAASEDILLSCLPKIAEIPFKKQDKSLIREYPKRSPEDGRIDLAMSARDLYNFIRAQSSPYPGAFIRTADGKKLVIEKARIEE